MDKPTLKRKVRSELTDLVDFVRYNLPNIAPMDKKDELDSRLDGCIARIGWAIDSLE
jgi:hypothetical protein